VRIVASPTWAPPPTRPPHCVRVRESGAMSKQISSQHSDRKLILSVPSRVDYHKGNERIGCSPTSVCWRPTRNLHGPRLSCSWRVAAAGGMPSTNEPFQRAVERIFGRINRPLCRNRNDAGCGPPAEFPTKKLVAWIRPMADVGWHHPPARPPSTWWPRNTVAAPAGRDGAGALRIHRASVELQGRCSPTPYSHGSRTGHCRTL